MAGIKACAVWLRAALLGSVAMFTCATAQAQVFNCYEGQGVLENAWNDWSWCSDNLTSTAYTYTGAYSVRVTYTGGWQAFSLESSNSFPAGYFSSLSFEINGGTTVGRSISVQLIANGNVTNAVNLNNYIKGGFVPANAWSKVTIPLSAFGQAYRFDQPIPACRSRAAQPNHRSGSIKSTGCPSRPRAT